MSVSVVVLAAGQGKRMHSDLPKVLHPVAGKPMVEHVLDVARAISDQKPIVIHGHGGRKLIDKLAHRDVEWVEQSEQLGTGHAVAQALPKISGDSTVLILYGDVPLLRQSSLERLIAAGSDTGFAVLTVNMLDATGYGRIVREPSGSIARIVEHKDANDAEQEIREINTGIMAIAGSRLRAWIPELRNDNAQHEYYLTDCVAMAVSEGIEVSGVIIDEPEEAMGVNDRRQLATVERLFQERIADQLMASGVTLIDPSRIDVRGDVECGKDVLIDVNVIFEGRVRIGNRVRIGANNVIADCEIADDVELLPNCVLDSASIGKGSRIGPFARIRPESRLADDVHIGNFVEIKKSNIAAGSKVNHLSYVGDAEIGSRVNVGAGTITCNYDGAYKHKTVLEDDVFVGSNTQLVAPVTVGRGVTIGAGTTVTEDVEADRLVISRVRQKIVTGWKRPQKSKK